MHQNCNPPSKSSVGANQFSTDYSKHHSEWSRLYLDGLTTTQIARRFGCGVETVGRYLKREGLIRTSASYRVKYKANEQYFTVIDDDATAYWLGFLAADGTVYHREDRGEYGVRLALQQADSGHVQQWLNAAESNAVVTSVPQTNSVTATIRSKQMFDDLVFWGVTPRKSLTLQWPHELEERWHAAFIRGYFDGDGSVSVHKRLTRNTAQRTVTMVGTFKFLEVVRDRLWQHADIKPTRLVPAGRYYVLAYGGNRSAQKFSNWIYKGASVWLERKRDKF